MAIIHEDVCDVHQYNVRAFPTYIAFVNETEKGRVEGANMAKIQALVDVLDKEHGDPFASSAGQVLGSGGGGGSAAEAALARFAAGSPPTSAPAAAPEKQEDPLETLMNSMGFSRVRAEKGLKHGNGTVEGAVEWISQHQDDPNIDDEEMEDVSSDAKAQSYKCNECGKIISNMANLELHAHKTGHSDFEESTDAVTPLTAEEKASKVNDLKKLLSAKRAEREAAEKAEEKVREIQRRNMGKEMSKTREQLDQEQRKRAAALRKKEKADFKRERERIRQELAKDKAERQSNKGKLSSKLGVDGYNPDGIQYDVDGEQTETADSSDQDKKKPKIDASRIDEYISKVSSYRAGGDGGKCLKIVKAYVSNLLANPQDPKFRSINMDNKAYKTKVKPFVGAKKLLLAVGFVHDSEQNVLVAGDDINEQLLAATRDKIEKALLAYG